MRILLLGVIVLAIFGFTDALAFDTHIGDDVFIMVQTSLRDSDGHLVTYLESTKFTYLDKPALESFLDYEASRGNNPVITLDGQKYQIIRRAQEITLISDNVVASTILSDNVNGNITLLARFAHDGYPAIPGDKIESIWTFVRPVS